MSMYRRNENDMCDCENNNYKNECYDKMPVREKTWEYENCDCKLAQHMKKYIGETVTVFTASGGVTGCGFTGVLIDVNCCFIRVVNKLGSEPACPIGSSCCCEHDGMEKGKNCYYVGSVSDIPIDSIVSFTHNAL